VLLKVANLLTPQELARLNMLSREAALRRWSRVESGQRVEEQSTG